MKVNKLQKIKKQAKMMSLPLTIANFTKTLILKKNNVAIT